MFPQHHRPGFRRGLTIRDVDNRQHQGAQGHLEEASRLALDNEFGTHQDEDVVKKILECGEVKEMKERERVGNTVRFSFLSSPPPPFVV